MNASPEMPIWDGPEPFALIQINNKHNTKL